MSTSLTDLIPEFQPYAHALIDLGGAAGVLPRVTSTLRTHSEQERLWRAYIRGERQYPAAPPGTSAHEYGYAFDMVAASQEDLHDLGFVWQQVGGVWSPRDEIHFQWPGFSPPPPQTIPEESVTSFLLDLAVGFIPVYGTITTVAALADYFGVSHSEAVKMLASPTHYVNVVNQLIAAYQ